MKKFLLVPLAIIFMAAGCNKQTLAKDEMLQIKQYKISVQLADTPAKRAQGLSGISAISDEEGMLFLFSAPSTPQFWMKDMKFGLDLIWINGDTIVGITDNAKPEPGKSDADLTRYTPPQPADKVLEVNAGWAYRHDVNSGDTVTGIK